MTKSTVSTESYSPDHSFVISEEPDVCDDCGYSTEDHPGYQAGEDGVVVEDIKTTQSNDITIVDGQTEQPLNLTEFNPIKVGEDIRLKSVLFELHIKSPGFYKKISAAQLINWQAVADAGLMSEEEAAAKEAAGEKLDPKKIHAWQEKINVRDPVLAAIWKLDNEFYWWIKDEVALSYKLIPSAHYLIPLARVAEVDARLQTFIEQRNILIEAAGNEWPRLCQEGRAGRGEFVSEADYPDFTIVRKKFDITYQYKSYDAPAALATISTALLKREEEKVALQWADTAQQVRDDLRAVFAASVEKFAKELGTDEETGKPRRLQKSSMNQLLKFLGNFDYNNMTNDTDLASVANQVKQLVQGMDVESIKKDVNLRAKLEASFATITNKLPELVEVEERDFSMLLEQ